MGPLSKIWTEVESTRWSLEDSVEVELKEIQDFVEQTALLLGQASNSISYYRRFYMLLALTNSPQESKQMPRVDLGLLQKNGKNLFGKKFRENIWHTSKSKKQTLEMLSNTSRKKYKPFHHGLPQTPRRQQQKLLLRKGTTSQYSKKRYNNGNQNSYGYGYHKYKPGNLVQQSEISLCSSSGWSKTHTSLHKKLILCNKNSKCALAGRLKNFIENWKILTKDIEILSLVEGYTIPFYEIPTIENIPNSPKLNQEENRKGSSKEGNSRGV